MDIIIASPDGKSLKNGTGIFLIMEYVENDLAKLLKDQSVELSEDHVVTITYNLLCALNFLHTAGVMHRDIKPGNILIDDMCQVKLCDFGFARCMLTDDKKPKPSMEIERQGTADTLGSVGSFVEDGGQIAKKEKFKRRLSLHVTSRWYRAPEVILLTKKYDTKVDMWAIGCTIAEICSLIKPESFTS